MRMHFRDWKMMEAMDLCMIFTFVARILILSKFFIHQRMRKWLS